MRFSEEAGGTFMSRALSALILFVMSTAASVFAAESPGLRLYVLRTGDDASDNAVKEALAERGHQVSLGVRASQLDSAHVRLSDFHAILALGAESEVLSPSSISALAKYVETSGGLITDGHMLFSDSYNGRGTAGDILRLPAKYCGWLRHGTASTSYKGVDPPDPVVHDGVSPDFPVDLTLVSGTNETCMQPSAGGRPLFNSKSSGEANPRAGLLVNEPGRNSRSASFSVSIRRRELLNPDFRRLFVNTVEWTAARSVPTTPADPSRESASRRVYVMRSGDDDSDQAVLKALTERGHRVSLGVRGSQLDAAQVKLSDYHAILALGAAEEVLSPSSISALAKYLENSGGLITDGHMLFSDSYNGRGTAGDILRLPAKYCGWLRHGNARTSYERVDPPDPVVHDGIPPAFPVDLTLVSGTNETCMQPAAGGKILLYSRAAENETPRAGVIANEPGPKSRIVSYSVSIRRRELLNSNFSRLFVNSVEWAAARSEPTTPPEPPSPPKKLRVYVLRSGDSASDDAVAEALRQRGHEVSSGVRASQIAMAPPLLGFQAVVAMGAERESMNAAGIAILNKYVESGGRLVVDGHLLFSQSYYGGAAGDTLAVAGKYCGWIRHQNGNTTYERIDPADPILHYGMPPSFQTELTLLAGMNETCMTPAAGGKLFFYSRAPGETVPRPAVLGNETTSGGRTMVFSAPFRRGELRSPEFRTLFVNAVEWVSGQVEPAPALRPSPAELSFVFKTSADAPRKRTLQVTSTTLNAVTFTATATMSSGVDWLSVTPGSATTPADIGVWVAPAFLAPGTYKGEVALTSGSSVVRVPVTTTIDAAPACQYQVSPLSASFSAGGGTGKIGIAVAPGCAWTVGSNSPWITVSSGASGSGPGTATYSIAQSPAPAARTGSLTVAGTTFAVTQSGTGLSFRLDPSGLDFRVAEGAPAPDGRVVSILPTATSANFSVSVSGGTWLSATPLSGVAPGSIIVSAASTGLAPGVLRGSVIIRIPNATVAEQTLPVTLTVEAAEPSQLRVEPTTMTLPSVQGGEAKTEQVQIVNRGRSNLTFRAAVEDAPWMTVQPDSGSVLSGVTQSLTVTGDPRGLPAGSYSGRLSVSTSAGEKATVNITLTVTAAGQSILLSQTGLSYTAVAQGGRVLPQSFGILNTGTGLMDWTLTPMTLSGGSWLSVSKTRGSADGSAVDIPLIDVGVNPGALRPGEYHGRITIASPTATNSPQIVSVLLQVLPPGSDPGPVVRPTGLIFVTPSGSAPASQEVMVSNPTADTRSYNSNRLTTDNTGWFTHTPVQSTVTPTQPTRISVQSSSTGLTSGVRKGVLTLLFGDGAVQNVNILSIVPPQAALTSKGERESASCASPKLVISHRTLRQDFIAVLGQGVSIEVKVADSCGNLLIPKKGASVAVVATFSNGDARLNLVHIGDGIWTGTWRPAQKADRVVVAVTAINAEGLIPNVQAEQVTVSGVVREGGRTPIITAGGLVHGASFAAGVPLAPGLLVTLYGANLADEAASPDYLPLPRELKGTEVLLGDRSLPLLFVSKDQVNVQVPFGLPSNTQHQISVRRGQELSVPETITVAEAVPGIFTKNLSGKGQGLIFKAEPYVLAEAASPAKAGDVIVVFCTGLGVVAPSVEPGDPSPSGPLARVPAAVELLIGGKKAQTVFVGLTSNAVGLYQINAVVPEGVEPGDAVSVVITAGGQTSPVVTMAVR